MDNITDEQLNRMVDLLADRLVKRIYGIDERQADIMWHADKEEDHMIGELARLMTLLNLYEDREEYEKCAAVKKHLDKVNNIVEKL